MDLIACNGSAITVLLGNGDGTFTALPPIGNPAKVSPLFLVMGDVSNDGKTDLFGFEGALDTYSTVVLGNGDERSNHRCFSRPTTMNLITRL